MNADIITDTTYPHGTTEGFTKGCHGSHCPAPMACRDVLVRYNGDFAFRRQINAGMTPAEIVAAETPEPPVRARKPAPAPKTPARKPRPSQRASGSDHANQVRELHGQGMLDKDIAAQIGIGRRTVTNIRDALGLAPHHGVDADHVRRLHTDGLTDRQIADRINQTRFRKIDRRTIWGVRKRLGLNPNPAPVTTGASSLPQEHA
jgi:transposase